MQFRIRDFGQLFIVQILLEAIYWRQIEGEFESFDDAKDAGCMWCQYIETRKGSDTGTNAA